MMNSAVPIPRKTALCRYFSSSGSCFYGENCTFLHESPKRHGLSPTMNGQPPHMAMPESTGQPEIGNAYNGDQFFTATFTPGDIPNGYPDIPPQTFLRGGGKESDIPPPFIRGPVGVQGKEQDLPPPPFMRGKGARSSPLSDALPLGSQDDSGLSDQFAAMAVATAGPHGKLHMALKGRNIGASEFVPTTGTPGPNGNMSGLSHSASTPSFQNYSATPINSQGSDTGTPSLAPTNLSSALSTGASPMNSPGMSPAGSPMTGRKNKSPVLLLNSATPPVQESVGGTTYFYSQEEMNSQYQGIVMPNFTMYPGMLPHVNHMKTKQNMPSFYMPDELKLEILNRQAITMAQIDPDQNPDIPQEVDNYHSLFPLEPRPTNPMHKSSTFGYPTTVYKATNTKDGLTYCLRRIHGFRLTNTKCMALIDLWKKMQHANIIQLREVFTTKAFGDHSMVFVYDYHPGSETLLNRHFSHRGTHHLNGYNNPYNLDGNARPFSAGKGLNRHNAGLLQESLIWSYIVQLSSALRTIHAHGLACRVMDPSKILITDKSRIRLNCVGIFDVLSFDGSQSNPLAMMPHYQQEDLMSLGRVVLALACNSLIGIQREHLQTSLELVNRNYSLDLKNLIIYLLSNQGRVRSINDVMPMIGARFYTQLDGSLLRSDVLENELAKEVENGRLLRLNCKLGVINERPEFNLDPSWSETGDRYMLKLFRDYVYHQVDENAAPWIDMSHIVQCLNKLDAGTPEKLTLMSRDEQNILVVTYAELKQCLDSSFSEVLQASQASGQHV